MGAETGNAISGVLILRPTVTWRGLKDPQIWVRRFPVSAVRAFAAGERPSVCAPGDISTCRHSVRTSRAPETRLIRLQPGVQPISVWSLRPSALRIERKNLCGEKHGLRSLNRESADCLRDAVFEVKHFQYTLFAPTDKGANRESCDETAPLKGLEYVTIARSALTMP
jgi:hypothetical protein